MSVTLLGGPYGGNKMTLDDPMSGTLPFTAKGMAGRYMPLRLDLMYGEFKSKCLEWKPSND